MRGKRLEPVVRRERRPDCVAGAGYRLQALKRPRLGHGARPSPRPAAASKFSLRACRIEVVERVERHAGRPNSRKRATPPSGKILKRTCVIFVTAATGW